MARKKTILKEHILETAYHVLRIEGFEGFTARNIAKQMDCSTQPIYLEFKNMDELKTDVMEKVYTYLTDEIYKCPRTGDHMLDFCINYVDFADKESRFFTALFLENQIDVCVLHQFSFQTLIETLNKDRRTKQLNSKEKSTIFERIWPTIHGTASMVAQGTISFNEQEIIHTVQRLIPETEKIAIS